MNNWQFAQPAFLIIVLPLLWLIWKPQRGIPFPLTAIFPHSPARYYSFILKGILSLAAAFWCVALARPQAGFEKNEIHREGIDIVLALDVSGSMRAEDFAPNRLKAAQEVISQFIEKQEGNRLALVTFAGFAFTQCPLTADYEAVKFLLEEVSLGNVKIDGTAIGIALLAAVNRFDELDEDEYREKSRIIVLLTDGENNAGEIEPLQAAEIAAAKKIKIYTIGVGKIGGAPIPYVDSWGNKRYARHQNGQIQLTKLNEPELRQIAQISGGRYFRADNIQRLEQIYKDIQNMEKSEFKIQTATVYQERYLPFLLAGCVLFMLWVLLNFFIFRELGFYLDSKL